MPFILSSEAKNAYSTNELYIFFASRDEINCIFIPKMVKNLNFLFIIYNFKRDRFLH